MKGTGGGISSVDKRDITSRLCTEMRQPEINIRVTRMFAFDKYRLDNFGDISELSYLASP